MKWSITASLYKHYFLSFSQFLATIVTQQKFLLITNITWECFHDEKNSNEKLSIVKNIFQLVSVWNFLFQKDGSEHNMQNFVYCDSNLNISVHISMSNKNVFHLSMVFMLTTTSLWLQIWKHLTYPIYFHLISTTFLVCWVSFDAFDAFYVGRVLDEAFRSRNHIMSFHRQKDVGQRTARE